ncbi:hypothetical protein [Leptospira selangorensis]|uniref:hypothetical protein n=1 Tax=Leptospira selangorensis TaxID=2484982 RepID=UPI001FEFE866|nr:hypothetical protein [Leptospira selangorensis]
MSKNIRAEIPAESVPVLVVYVKLSFEERLSLKSFDLASSNSRAGALYKFALEDSSTRMR